MSDICYRPIGTIHSPFIEPGGTPIQAVAARDAAGTVEVLSQYADGLKDLQGFSHIMLLYHFHVSKSAPLLVTPYMDDTARGIFATRAPSRPNPIGLSIVRLTGIAGRILHVQDLDIVDGTPLLDVKPYVPQFDNRAATAIGWLEERVRTLDQKRDNGRFAL